MYGNLGFPKLELVGAGIATTLSTTLMFTGMALVVTFERQFRRYRLFGRFWRSDWPRFVQMFKLGAPIAGILAFEVSIFNAATFMMGLIGPVALAVTTSANIDFMRKPAAGVDLLAECRVLKLGRVLAVAEALIFSEGAADPVARCSMTYSIPPKQR